MNGPIYEFGSYLVEGQQDRGNLRGFFPGKPFTGCDMRRGPGVDRLENLSQLSLPNHVAQSILCLDTLEHVFEVERAVQEMIRILAPGGIMALSVPMNFPIHDYPDDYWRLTPSCLMRLLGPLDGRVIGYQGEERYPHTIFALGFKAPFDARLAVGVNRLLETFQAWLDQTANQLSWSESLKRWKNLYLRGKGQRQAEQNRHRAQFVVDLPSTFSLTKPHSHLLQKHPALNRHGGIV